MDEIAIGQKVYLVSGRTLCGVGGKLSTQSFEEFVKAYSVNNAKEGAIRQFNQKLRSKFGTGMEVQGVIAIEVIPVIEMHEGRLKIDDMVLFRQLWLSGKDELSDAELWKIAEDDTSVLNDLALDELSERHAKKPEPK